MNPYIEIIRPSITLMSALGVLVGAIVADANFSILLIYAMIAAFFIAGAGLVVNDYYDYEIDKINAPHRVLPSRRMSKRSAVFYGFILFVAGIFFSSLINPDCMLLAIINALLEVLYARHLKRIAIIGNATDSWFVASTFIFGALITRNFHTVWILSLLAFLANMSREIFGDIEDIKGDKKMGLMTLPIITSVRVSKLVASMFILLSVLLSFLPYFFGLLNIKYLIIVFIADLLFIVSLFQDSRTNQKITKIAMFIALVAFLVGRF